MSARHAQLHGERGTPSTRLHALGPADAPLAPVQVQLIDPGSKRSSVHYALFQEQCVRGFLAARSVATEVVAVVALMADSRLPCYGRGRPVENLRARFRLDDTPAQAATFMRGLVEDSYNKWTTGFYDYIQALQQGIPM